MSGLHRRPARPCEGLDVDKIVRERGELPGAPVDRVALVAQYSPGAVQPRSLSAYVDQLAGAGYLPVIISTAPGPGPLEFPHGLADSAIILRRPNIGYDFGSWAAVLLRYAVLRRSRVVLLTNDSLLGPFAPINELLEWAAQPGPDIKALTASTQLGYHAQSFFLAFHGGILDDEAWRFFFGGVRPLPTKDDVVRAYELGLSRFAFGQAYSIHEYLTPARLGVGEANPTIDGWKAILDAGVPFVKRTLLTHRGLEKIAEEASDYVKEKYHVNVSEW